ncbi:hypothetical protein J6590_007674 [Homalodisca vitripennis]|nr:hypothetical protein J6590_007674 [Homalodisca vitripennis]
MTPGTKADKRLIPAQPDNPISSVKYTSYKPLPPCRKTTLTKERIVQTNEAETSVIDRRLTMSRKILCVNKPNHLSDDLLLCVRFPPWDGRTLYYCNRCTLSSLYAVPPTVVPRFDRRIALKPVFQFRPQECLTGHCLSSCQTYGLTMLHSSVDWF